MRTSYGDSNVHHRWRTGAATVFTFIVLVLLALPASTHGQPRPVNCQVDVDGANDKPGQKDLTRFCIDSGDGAPFEWHILVNWDETRLNGANTADVCTIYDTNSNTLADLALCVTLESSGAANDNLAVFQQFRFYTCGDSRADRCMNATEIVVAAPTTFCEVDQRDSDPFPPSVARGPGDEYPMDTETLCRIDQDDFAPAGTSVVMIDGCAHPSQQPNSSPSDCVVYTECSVDGDCDDKNVCTTDSCGTDGFCLRTPNDGAACTDGLFCNGDDLCNALGLCANVGSRDCDDGVSCTVDVCDELLEQCINDPRNSLCSDGVFCNGVETCDLDDDCRPGSPRDCGDGVACTVDSCNESTKSCSNAADDALCDDGAYCNGVEACDAASGCQTGVAVDCADAVGCTADRCNEDTDSCDNTPENTSCDDGAFCNGAETCHAATDCQSGSPPACGDGVGCTIDSCNELTDACDNTPDDAACGDGAFCNGVEACDVTTDCQAGLAPDCDDGVPCTVDSCSEADDTCRNSVNHAACDDGLFCTGVELCDAANDCRAGTPPDCDDGVNCTVDSCDESASVCRNDPNDALCDNGSFCDGAEICDSSNDCGGGPPPNCDDGVACTGDACNEAADTCDNTPDNGSCDDGAFCTGVEICDTVNDCQEGAEPCPGASCDEGADTCAGCLLDTDCNNDVFCDGAEVCSAGNCIAGAPPDCGDAVACTADACDEDADRCRNLPQHGLCDDGSHCNGLEICDVVNGCQAGTAPGCDDGVPCTVDLCNEQTDSCDNPPDDGSCSDGLFCTGTESCDPVGGCQAGQAAECNDGIGCTIDTCDEVARTCKSTPSDAACSNGQFCDGAELCDPVSDCQGGSAPDCDDGVACTVDSCDEVGNACANDPVDALCANGTFCDGVETCDPQEDCLTGIAVDCDDDVDCTLDVCRESQKKCRNTPRDSMCDDGTACNGVEKCDATYDCRSGSPVQCNDNLICSRDTCNPVNGNCTFDFSSCTCGDGEVAGTEDCEPPELAGTFEDCNNMIDDDGDGAVDCLDLDCAPGAREPLCDEFCMLDAVCKRIGKDPALIRYRQPRRPDSFRLHGRFEVDPTFNPATEGVEFELADQRGAIYRVLVPPGVLESNRTGTRFRFRDKTASSLGAASHMNGIRKLSFISRAFGGVPHATFRITAYGDFSAATKVTMTSRISVGPTAASLTADWTPKPLKWKLSLTDW